MMYIKNDSNECMTHNELQSVRLKMSVCPPLWSDDGDDDE